MLKDDTMISENEFEKIKKTLEEHENRLKKLENLFEEEKEKPIKKIGVDIEECIKKLSKDADINVEEIRHIFDFNKEDVKLIKVIKNKKESEKQCKATVCVLTVYHYCYGKNEIKSRDLRKKLEWLGIKSLGNLSINLSHYKQYIIPVGKSGSPAFSYKITYPGIKKGLKNIKELAST